MMWNPNLAATGLEIWHLPTFPMMVADDVSLCWELMVPKCPIMSRSSDYAITSGANNVAAMAQGPAVVIGHDNYAIVLRANNVEMSHCVRSQQCENVSSFRELAMLLTCPLVLGASNVALTVWMLEDV